MSTDPSVTSGNGTEAIEGGGEGDVRREDDEATTAAARRKKMAAYYDLIVETRGFKDDGCTSETSIQQVDLENLILKFLYHPVGPQVKLLYPEHITFLLKSIADLPPSFQSLDASQPWLLYWSLNALDLLHSLPPTIAQNVASTLAACQHPTGGYAGGIGQLAHLAATYAATRAIGIVGGPAFAITDRKKMLEFLLRIKQPDGSFISHDDGETDIRGAYCAIATAAILNILTPALVAGTAEWIGRCQTYEGGLGGFPGNEAHGGYAYCGVAALHILGRMDVIDIPALLHWLSQRQMVFEGGFQGRTNKLVDSCYSFWQGSVFPLVASATNGAALTSDHEWLFDPIALKHYVLHCCQDMSGGLRDKPGKGRDLYHTCYALSGLSLAQYTSDENPSSALSETDYPLAPLCPEHGFSKKKVAEALRYFGTLPNPP
ncbi:protein farnesyltransferase subunit beta [Pelomyxa schiedti]|nr:protein farnesyltransferase subunit beta [Pelomyxa schiedti]